MHISEVTMRSFDDVKVGDECKPNPFIEWDYGVRTYEVPYIDKYGYERTFHVTRQMTEQQKTYKVCEIKPISEHDAFIDAYEWSYPRDMLLIKGVDY